MLEILSAKFQIEFGRFSSSSEVIRFQLEFKDLKGSHLGQMSDIGVLELKFRVHNKFKIALSQNYRGQVNTDVLCNVCPTSPPTPPPKNGKKLNK